MIRIDVTKGVINIKIGELAMSSLISITKSIFNGGRTIGTTIESLINQASINRLPQLSTNYSRSQTAEINPFAKRDYLTTLSHLSSSRGNSQIHHLGLSISKGSYSTSNFARKNSYDWTKRLFDIVLAVIGIVVLIPVTLPIALLIYLNDRGSVFFSQKRMGLNLRPFTLYKFRSMTVDKSSANGSFDVGDQSRVTRIGKVLRRTKLDELPQLINVLKGDMSFVGPRPEVKKWVDVYPVQWAHVLTVKPGITDNAAILFRNEEEILSLVKNPEIHYKEIILPQKLTIYSEYIENHSFTGDLAIIAKTIYSIVKK